VDLPSKFDPVIEYALTQYITDNISEFIGEDLSDCEDEDEPAEIEFDYE
jgi:hypothetical protein